MDRLDKIITQNSMKGNLVKWWSVNYVPATSDNNFCNSYNNDDTSIASFDVLNDTDKVLAEKILDENSNQYVFDKVSSMVDVDNVGLEEPKNDNLVLDEANAIYERLMREAAEDEAKKQAEIEAAKKAYE